MANRLIQVDVDGTAVFAAAYDARTRRLSKIEGTDTTTFRYDGGTSFKEFKNGDLSVEFVRGSGMGGGIGSILYRDTFNPDGTIKATESYHYNAVGHVDPLRLETDERSAFGMFVDEFAYNVKRSVGKAARGTAGAVRETKDFVSDIAADTVVTAGAAIDRVAGTSLISDRDLSVHADRARDRLIGVKDIPRQVKEELGHATQSVVFGDPTDASGLMPGLAGSLLTRRPPHTAVRVAQDGVPARATTGGSDVSLEVLDPSFTPDTGRYLQNAVDSASTQLGGNRDLVGRVRSPGEMGSAAGSAGLFNTQYGNTVERLAGRTVREDTGARTERVGFINCPKRKLLLQLYISSKSWSGKDLDRLNDVLFLHGFLSSFDEK
ncbi:MAG: hypothetical protein AAF710_00290 [Planctomycetota bacterium]